MRAVYVYLSRVVTNTACKDLHLHPPYISSDWLTDIGEPMALKVVVLKDRTG